MRTNVLENKSALVATVLAISLTLGVVALGTAFAVVGNITIDGVNGSGTGPYDAFGVWSTVQNQPCHNAGTGFRYFINVFEDEGGDGAFDDGTDGILQVIDPAPCDGGVFEDPGNVGLDADDVNWPAVGQSPDPATFNLDPGEHNICAALYHVGQQGADLVGVPACLDNPIVVEVPGCTDPGANNYNPNATQDDGSCTYDPEFSDVTICKYDNLENLLSGWDVDLGSEEYSGTTDENGCVTLNDVLYGDYTLGETLQAGWQNDSGDGENVTVDEPTETFNLVNSYPGCTDDSALNFDPNATINDESCEYEDPAEIIVVNKDAAGGGSTEFLFTTNWEVFTLTDAQNPKVSPNLGAGEYTITESATAGWELLSVSCNVGEGQSTASSTENGVVVTLAEDETVTCTFTNRPTQHTITGTKYEFGSDPLQGLSGWTIFIDENDNGILDGEELSDVTDENGNYSFEGLAFGAYEVCEVEQEGYTRVTPSETNCHTVDFGNDESGVRNFYNDRNESDPDATRIIVRKATNESGNQQFEFDPSWTENFSLVQNSEQAFDLESGTYSVEEVNIPNGWDFDSVSCVSSIQDTEVNTEIELDNEETVTCTFTNSEETSGGGGGGGGRRSEPEPEVLGEQTEILPAAAPNTGVPVAGVDLAGALSTLVGLLGLSFVNRKK